MKYRTLIYKGATDYDVIFPDFPGCVSGGDTLCEAIFNAKEALQLHVDGMLADNDTIPNPFKLEECEDWVDQDYFISIETTIQQ